MQHLKKVTTKGTIGVGTVQPYSGDQSKDGRRSLQKTSYVDPSPAGGGSNSIYKHKSTIKQCNSFIIW